MKQRLIDSALVSAPVAAAGVSVFGNVNEFLTMLSLLVGITGGALIVWREVRALAKRREEDK